MGVLQLLDADETTVLFDFHDPTGAGELVRCLIPMEAGVELDDGRGDSGPVPLPGDAACDEG
jgi:hypothetical protein